MTIKKFLSLAMASTLALSMAAPAFAIGEDEGGTDVGGGSTVDPTPTPTPEEKVPNQFSFNYEGTTEPYKAPVISLTLPTTTSNIILNPYGVACVKPGSNPAATTTDTVLSDGLKYIKNTSTFDVDVEWEVLGTAHGGVEFTDKAKTAWTSTTAKKKLVKLPVAIAATTENSSSHEPDAVTSQLQVGGKDVFVKATAQSSKEAITLHGTATTVTAPATKNPYLGFGILTGNTATDAEACDGHYGSTGEKTDLTSEWTAEDSVDVSFVFTFAKA